MRMVVIALWAALAMLGGQPASAETQTISVYSARNEVEKAALATLDKHCARCNQAVRLVNRQKPAKALGNILQLDRIATNPALVQPSNPKGFRIVQQIVNKDMPHDVYEETDFNQPTPTDDEIKTLRSWIESLNVQCQVRPVSINRLVKMMADDIGSLPDHRRAGT